MKLIFILLLFYVFSISVYSQNIRTICAIPSSLAENSGVLVSSSNSVWLHNDGGDLSKLYQIDTFGNILRTIEIQNATNIDWEDITHDNQGNVYIGDFGNNSNNRQNLRIYKIPHPDLVLGSTVTAEIINYYYPEQTAFPPQNNEKKYDTEAMVYYEGALYVFTKDRTVPHLGYTWLYKVPVDSGSYAAELIDSFNTQQSSYIFEITAASISSDGSILALLSANRIWLFSDFIGNQFFDGNRQSITLNISQKEGLDFLDNNHIYISNESSIFGSAELSVLTLPNIVLGVSCQDNMAFSEKISVFPNPVLDNLNVKINLDKTSNLTISLFNLSGMRLKVFQDRRVEAGEQHLNFSVNEFPAGVYFLHFSYGEHQFSKKVVLYR
ncbi:MAG: T9SS type A sorting domain-containing protein [Saprospiraceae bacterium]|nr:T9SS type A sorting domain-containing protein [Saprospiraceae bacterium]